MIRKVLSNPIHSMTSRGPFQFQPFCDSVQQALHAAQEETG